MDRETRQRYRRLFEDTLRKVSETHVPVTDMLVEAQAPTADGVMQVVAIYKIYRDGHCDCFQVLDDALWPGLEP
jgi:hypothetical protein